MVLVVSVLVCCCAFSRLRDLRVIQLLQTASLGFVDAISSRLFSMRLSQAVLDFRQFCCFSGCKSSASAVWYRLSHVRFQRSVRNPVLS